MNNFWTRTISGAVFAGVVIACIWYNQWSLIMLLWLISVVGIFEFLKLRKSTDPLSVIFGILLGSLFILIPVITKIQPYIYISIAAIALIFVLISLLRFQTLVYKHVSNVFIGCLYVAIPVTLFLDAVYDPFDYEFRKPLFIFLLVWSSDTFAYLTGRALGNHHLAPKLSPKKTWEGFIGGSILTAILGGFLGYIWISMEPYQGVILGLCVGIFGTAGDLFESALKRNAEVKDSGNIIPGHGGVLDRFDAFLFACIVCWCTFQWLEI
ncbi:MAG: phosphatidate cytidylyltransferase [Bacteroidetes bacterium]|nr:phosphatidate cytidylyltransferase [Bacteroidota bacterium]